MKRREFLQMMGVLAMTAAWPKHVAAQAFDDPEAVFERLKGQPDLKFLVGNGNISVVVAGDLAPLQKRQVETWVRRSASAVSGYFGRFPVDHWALLIVPEDGSRIGPATTWGYPSSFTRVGVGREVGEERLRDDWVMVHEMTHLALPRVPMQSEWLLEGNATYVEPIARAQLGQIPPQEVWRWAVDDMPRGQPQAGDEGLDHTHTWARTYWGGAMYWLLAEITIYKKSRGRFRLQDALRAINRASGGNTAFWSVEQVTHAGDAALKLDALTSLYNQLKDRPVAIDLDDILRQLGVAETAGVIRFDDRAPLAELRRSITSAH